MMTNEEILQIAKRCYPVGTEYYGAYAVSSKRISKESALKKVTSENYNVPNNGCIHEPSTSQDFIYHANKWAEIVLPEPKLGMKVVRGPKYAKKYVLNDEVGYIIEILEGDTFRVDWENTGIDGTNSMCMGGVIPVVGKNSNKEEKPKYELGDIVLTRKGKLGVVISEGECVRYFSDDISSYPNIDKKASNEEISIYLKKVLKARFPDGVKVLSLYGSERTLDCSNFDVQFMNGISCYDNKGRTKILRVENDEVKWAEIIGLPSREEFKIKEEIGEVVTPLSNDGQIKSSQNGTSEEVQNAIEQISGRDEQGAIIIQSKQSKIEVRDFDLGYSRVIVRSKRKIRVSEG